jgi:hypothetical protein
MQNNVIHFTETDAEVGYNLDVKFNFSAQTQAHGIAIVASMYG